MEHLWSLFYDLWSAWYSFDVGSFRKTHKRKQLSNLLRREQSTDIQQRAHSACRTTTPLTSTALFAFLKVSESKMQDRGTTALRRQSVTEQH